MKKFEERIYTGDNIGTITIKLPVEMVGKTIAPKNVKLVGVEIGKGILPEIPDIPAKIKPITKEEWKQGFEAQ